MFQFWLMKGIKNNIIQGWVQLTFIFPWERWWGCFFCWQCHLCEFHVKISITTERGITYFHFRKSLCNLTGTFFLKNRLYTGTTLQIRRTDGCHFEYEAIFGIKDMTILVLEASKKCNFFVIYVLSYWK